MIKKYSNIIMLIVVPSVIGLLYNYIRSDSIDLLRETKIIEWVDDTELSGIFENDSVSNIKSLRTHQVFELFENGKAKLIDARDEWDYNDGHIQGAINLPAYDFEINNPNLSDLDRNSLIVIYCGDEECDLSKKLASGLMDIGFKNVYIYVGGWFEWLESGYPIEVSESK
ncbi:MAG: rhodanese-like domain-containing protein [Melioribacteraceae bacterium]|nr:rhodanese-like domain-containing protein [Melioribacteraceae bacterium]